MLTAPNATEASDIMKQHTDIDIVFSDIVMPQGMSGVELARLVRARYPEVRFILTSA